MRLYYRSRAYFIWGTLLVYAIARVCQIFAGQLPTLLITLLHVVPPALFALVHGSLLYRPRGIAVFAALCLGFGTLAESVSLRTGFPFGHYYFTDVMGPKIFQLPVLLALAYLGIGYVAWILALLIPGSADKPIHGTRVVLLPLLASLIMVAWDLSMDPTWSLLDGAWIWQDGGRYFGVPVSNFFGWFFTGYIYYQAFALLQGQRKRGGAGAAAALASGHSFLCCLWSGQHPRSQTAHDVVCGNRWRGKTMADSGYYRQLHSRVPPGDVAARLAGMAQSASYTGKE